MGSYSAPAFANLAEKYVVDNTTPDDAVVIGPTRCFNPQIIAETSALFDGDVWIEFQVSNLSWSQLDHFNLADKQYLRTMYISTFGPGTFYKPLMMRIRVETACTIGACTVRLLASPPPANPLF